MPRTLKSTGPITILPLRRQAADERENRPADGVIQDRGREDDLAEIAAEIVHLAEDGGNDFDGGNGQRCCEEERREQAPIRIGQNACPAASLRARSRSQKE